MKNTICISLAMLFTLSLFAQDKTLFSREHRAGFFFSPIVEYSDIDNEVSTSAGAGLAFIAGDFFFGAYGMGLTSYQNIFDGKLDQLDMGHGGFWIGFSAPQQSVVHAFSSVKLGWGGLNLEIDDDDLDIEDGFFVVTPEIGVEFNVFRWFRIAATGGYRFINGIDGNATVSDDDFKGLTGALTFRIGYFGKNKRHRNSEWYD